LNLTDSEVVVPIPVFKDSNVAEELTNVTHDVPQPFVPTIAITKPPAPAPVPVGLPTVNDVISLPSPPDSQRSSSEDLETGLGLGMRDMHTEVVIGRNPPRHPTTSKKVEIPVERIISTVDDLHIGTPPPVVENVPDLLADPAPAMEAVPLQPSTPTIDAVELDAHGSSQPIVTPELLQEEVEEPVSTIRLVGGGGSSGIIDVSADDSILEPAADVIVPSPGSSSSPSKKDNTHEKSKSSLSSLKKIANIGGGKRKKDSSSSIKETI